MDAAVTWPGAGLQSGSDFRGTNALKINHFPSVLLLPYLSGLTLPRGRKHPHLSKHTQVHTHTPRPERTQAPAPAPAARPLRMPGAWPEGLRTAKLLSVSFQERCLSTCHPSSCSWPALQEPEYPESFPAHAALLIKLPVASWGRQESCGAAGSSPVFTPSCLLPPPPLLPTSPAASLLLCTPVCGSGQLGTQRLSDPVSALALGTP